jgi:hypothetical protein
VLVWHTLEQAVIQLFRVSLNLNNFVKGACSGELCIRISVTRWFSFFAFFFSFHKVELNGCFVAQITACLDVLNLNTSFGSYSVVDVDSGADETELGILLHLFLLLFTPRADCDNLFSLLCHGFREVDIQVHTQAHCHQCAALVVQFLHNDETACVQVSQTENHSTML